MRDGDDVAERGGGERTADRCDRRAGRPSGRGIDARGAAGRAAARLHRSRRRRSPGAADRRPLHARRRAEHAARAQRLRLALHRTAHRACDAGRHGVARARQLRPGGAGPATGGRRTPRAFERRGRSGGQRRPRRIGACIGHRRRRIADQGREEHRRSARHDRRRTADRRHRRGQRRRAVPFDPAAGRRHVQQFVSAQQLERGARRRRLGQSAQPRRRQHAGSAQRPPRGEPPDQPRRRQSRPRANVQHQCHPRLRAGAAGGAARRRRRHLRLGRGGGRRQHRAAHRLHRRPDRRAGRLPRAHQPDRKHRQPAGGHRHRQGPRQHHAVRQLHQPHAAAQFGTGLHRLRRQAPAIRRHALRRGDGARRSILDHALGFVPDGRQRSGASGHDRPDQRFGSVPHPAAHQHRLPDQCDDRPQERPVHRRRHQHRRRRPQSALRSARGLRHLHHPLGRADQPVRQRPLRADARPRAVRRGGLLQGDDRQHPVVVGHAQFAADHRAGNQLL